MLNSKRIIALAATLALLGFTAAPVLAHGDEDHEAGETAMMDCHEAHEHMKEGKSNAAHMKNCHDKNGKELHAMGKDGKMPMHDHKMHDHGMHEHK